jgi:chorismate dehydratase
VIGDEALRQAPRCPFPLDLGKAWQALTGLPFVFAVWAVRVSVWAGRSAEVRALHQALLRSKACSLAEPEAILAVAASRTGLPRDACRRYLQERLSFDLTPRHLEGLRTFLQMLADAGALPAVPSLRFIEP